MMKSLGKKSLSCSRKSSCLVKVAGGGVVGECADVGMKLESGVLKMQDKAKRESNVLSK
jgi:uncharacterized membrane protein YqgA involved in biofilm formation